MLIRSTLRALFLVRRGTIGGLSEQSAGMDPIALFEKWFKVEIHSHMLDTVDDEIVRREHKPPR